MKVQINKSNNPVSESEIIDFEQVSGLTLPLDYQVFLRVHNGMEPEANMFDVSSNNSSGVNGFIPISNILTISSNIATEIKPYEIAIAWAEGGNYIILNTVTSEISFWDHEEPSNTKRLALSFTEFLEILEPFDISKIVLKPGQVKSAWIDPDFLKSLGET